ncbi:MAG: gamma-glutamyltranspeptidase / glutathione hydrolase [Rhodospirillaceae bacterium]|nr:gamma-glutamyltranspeptidase / glutathione hydrolase [Rhodospirillaceae bacterium]
MRDFQLPGRSPIRVSEAAAATSHPLATLTAIEALRDGGNAVDAAVAAAAVLAVVEPESTGIGGDGFMLYAPSGSAEVIAFNGSGRSPKAATPEWYREHGFDSIPTFGPHSVTVPGLVDAWARIVADHGTRELGALLQPAIRYAENGYVVLDRVAFDWAYEAERLAADPDAARLLMPQGRAPRPGERLRQPELAATLRRIAEKGRDGFYLGPVAEDLVGHLRSLGGLHGLEDFAEAAGDYVEPIHTTYRGVDIHQIPPNNQGLTALIMLNILSGYRLGEHEPLGADRLHLEIEAGRLAYRDRNALIADPTKVEVPVGEMLSMGYADRLRERIDLKRAITDLPPPLLRKSDTVYLCVVDRDRNAVSLINSIYHSFGSGIVGPRSGVVLQNRGASFRLDPRHPNCIAPRKRPMHTIMPGMAMRDGRAMMPFGVMGGDYQPFGHVHLLTNLLDYGMDPQAALDCPRVFHSEGLVEVERGIPSQAVAGLEAKGHRTVAIDEPLGGGQAILIDWQAGTLTAGSDPRKDGCALGY